MALKLKGSTSGFVAIDAPSVAGNNTIILPENTGSAHQILANDITAGVTTFTQITVSRNGDLTVPGTISIGGTLTYEDVTSVDSVGIVTARGLSIFGNTTGLQVASGISTFQAVTATTGTFTGDVSIPDTIVHTGDTNTKIRFPAADNISFEVAGVERLRIDNSDGVIAKHTTAANLRIQNSTAAASQIATLDMAPANGLSGVQLKCTSEEDFSTGANRTAFFSVHNRKDGTFYERLRIDSSGRLLLGTATTKSAGSGQYAKLNVEGYAGGNECFVSLSRAEAASTMSADDEVANLTFNDSAGYEFARIQVLADAATGTTDTPGRLSFRTTADGASSSTERLRIKHNGHIAIGDDIANDTGMFKVQAADGQSADQYVGQFNNLEATAGQSYGVNIRAGSNSTDHGLRVMNRANDTTQFLVRGDGRIGINENSPDNIVHIKDGNPYVEIEGTSNSGDAGVFLNAKANHWIMRADNSGSQNLFSVKSGDPSSSTHRFVINSVGDFGFNDTTPTANASNNNTVLSLKGKGSSYSGKIDFKDSDGNLDNYINSDNAVFELACDPGSQNGNTVMQFKVHGNNERMRIRSNGQVLIGTTDANSISATLAIAGGTVPSYYANPAGLSVTTPNGADAHCVEFFQGRYNKRVLTQSTNYNSSFTFTVYEQADNTVGSVTGNGSATTYGSGSDYRLKENISNITDGITRLKQLTPRRFNWITDSTKTLEDGFIAHEVSPVIPEAVIGEKDALEEDGSIDPQLMDYGKVTPLLTAALQEAITKIETLEAEVAALKGS